MTPDASPSTPYVRPNVLMVVDDEPDVLDSVAALLSIERPNLLIHAFTSPIKALAAIAEDPPTAILTDFRMPGMDGAQFIAAAHRLHPALPASIMTAFSDPRTLAAPRGLIGMRVMLKPMDDAELLSEVDLLLEEAAHA